MSAEEEPFSKYFGDKLSFWKSLAPVGSAAIIITCFTYMYVMMAQFGGTTDNHHDLKAYASDILWYSTFGSLALFIGAALYFYQNMGGMFYFIFAVACIAFAIAYSSISIGLIIKK
jgi:hypothetical protein